MQFILQNSDGVGLWPPPVGYELKCLFKTFEDASLHQSFIAACKALIAV